jgi:hypothetical protein
MAVMNWQASGLSAFDAARCDTVAPADDIELRPFRATHQAWWVLHEVNVGARPTRLPFIGAIDQAHQVAQLHSNRRDQARMTNPEQA